MPRNLMQQIKKMGFPAFGLLLLVGQASATTTQTKPGPSYNEAIRCSASHLLLHAIHVERKLSGLAKHHEDRMSLWINYAIASSGKSVDQAFADQTEDFDMLNEKFVNEDNEPANEEFISTTVGKCTDLEKAYSKQINAASEF